MADIYAPVQDRVYAGYAARTCAAELGEKPADGPNFPHHLPGHCPILLLPTTTTQYTHYQLVDATALNQGRDMLKQNILYQALTTQSTHSEEAAAVEVVLFEQPPPNGPGG